MEGGRNAFKILTGTPVGMRPLGRRPRRRWEDNIIMDLEEIGINRCIGLIRLRIGIIGESPCECGIEPPGSIRHEIS